MRKFTKLDVVDQGSSTCELVAATNFDSHLTEENSKSLIGTLFQLSSD